MVNTPRNRAFMFYQSMGLIPLDAKRSDWALHHMDETLKERDFERYKQYNVYDVIPVPFGVHTRLHMTGNQVSDETKEKLSRVRTGTQLSEETRKKMSESRMGNTNARGKRWSEESKAMASKSHMGKHWKLVDGKRVYYE